MAISTVGRDLSGRAAAGLDLLSSRLRQSNHIFRRGKSKNVSIFILCVVSLLAIGAVIHGIQRSNGSMDFLLNDQHDDDDDDYSDDSTHLDNLNAIYDDDEGSKPVTTHTISGSGPAFKSPARKKSFHEMMTLIKKHSPEGSMEGSTKKKCDLGDISITDTDKFHKLTEESLKNCMDVSDDTVTTLKDAQAAFRKSMATDILPLFHHLEEAAFQGEGIVIVGGGKYSLFALPAIKAIRENSGTKIRHSIPIEIIIPPKDNADRAFCENVVPKLDPLGRTKCVFLDEILDEETLSHIDGYQIKPLAALVSSFKKVLLLDADNYVVNSIEDYFKHKTFQDKGLVLWPDYWRRLHHPRLYDIMDLRVATQEISRNSIDDATPSYMYKVNSKDAPFHDMNGALPDGGTESGQILVDKEKHLDTLIFSLYLNYNGQSFYYPLLGQGFAGQGDKDTFVLASLVLHGKDSWYQVKTPVDALGHWADQKDEIRLTPEELAKAEDKKSFRGTAMLQHDYVEDVNFKSLAREMIHNSVRDKAHAFCDEWSESHKGEFSSKEDERRKQCEKDQKVQDAFHEQIRKSYSLNDYLLFFKFTKVSFVHSHLPKYDPWEWYHSGDMMYDGAKASKNHKDDATYQPPHSGHYRMYDSKIEQVTSYDLELENWSAFNTYLCQSKDGYKNFGYLTDKISSSKSPTQSYQGMCAYIEDRVKFLESTTWESVDV
ncbi:LADA_0B08284g1_1 [Lachancea dasiensis]|uniref:LADA_0B08284g1_1 n=1 Tax=Lachancea dasiensis TaxID=1072105 RepID=A0A1G4IUE3_9SACH|nr:LADA_0B08284g1_1 [Lachancea dasiensis]